MGFFIIALLVLVLYESKTVKPGQKYFEDYMSHDNMTAVRGFFILLIFLSHAVQYLKFSSPLAPMDELYFQVRNFFGQSVVSMFFFYSGYGVIESVEKKGKAYIKSFPKNRFLKVLLYFDIAVLLYLVTATAINKNYDLTKTLLAFISWVSIGNTNWFVFDLLAAYLITYISFLIFSKKDSIIKAVMLVTALSTVFIFIMLIFQESRYYNTFLCYVSGMWYSLYKGYFENFVKTRSSHILSLLFVFLLTLFILFERATSVILTIPATVIFSVAFVMLTMFFRMKNSVLMWYGKRWFSLFMIMRIPMLLLSFLKLNKNNFLFVLTAFILSTALAAAFDKFLEWLDGKLFREKETTDSVAE